MAPQEYAIIAIVLIIIYLGCQQPCGCGCWRWTNCAANLYSCCKYPERHTQAMSGDYGGINMFGIEMASNPGHDYLNDNRTVILYYTEWCSFCREMKPIWNSVKAKLQGRGYKFIEVNGDNEKSIFVTSYPTIMMLDRDGRRRTYNGRADLIQLRHWILAPTQQGTIPLQ